jgi:hypothetical protein
MRVRRNEKAPFKQSDDLGRSLSQDVRHKAKTVVKPGHGERAFRSLGIQSHLRRAGKLPGASPVSAAASILKVLSCGEE